MGVPQMTACATPTGMGSKVAENLCWDYQASRRAKLRLATNDDVVESSTNGRGTISQEIRSTTNGWGTSPDVLALPAALGWRKKVQSVFQPQHGDLLTRFAFGP